MLDKLTWLVHTICVIDGGRRLASGCMCLCDHTLQKAVASETRAGCPSLGCCASVSQIVAGWDEWVLSNFMGKTLEASALSPPDFSWCLFPLQ